MSTFTPCYFPVVTSQPGASRIHGTIGKDDTPAKVDEHERNMAKAPTKQKSCLMPQDEEEA